MSYTDNFQGLNRDLAAIEQEVRNLKSQVLSLTGNPEEDEPTLDSIRSIADGNLDAAVESLRAGAASSLDQINNEFAAN